MGEQNASLPFGRLSRRCKIEYEMFEDLNKMWETVVSNHVIKVTPDQSNPGCVFPSVGGR